ncbi:MAG: N-acyl homoserine lactonase family protein [bacterium]|nr:N-acyl homoserine lactonase family protein [bacterium]
MQTAPYTIYAIQYAHRKTNSTELFYGDYHNTPMAMDYFIWALTNGEHTVVVDLGFTEEVGTRRGRQFLRCPSKGLAEIGIDCKSVEHVIVSHFHYDHVGNYALFPNATFYVQDDEMSFYTGRHASQPAFKHSIEIDDVVAMVRYNYDGRLKFIDGEEEIVPGISVHGVGGHTAGLQIVSTQTKEGRAVLTSDAAHYYHNFENNVPFMVIHSIPQMYQAFQRIRQLADKPELIIPGHDPLVQQRLHKVAEGIVCLG